MELLSEVMATDQRRPRPGSRLLKAWIFDDSVTFWWAIISVSVVIFLLLAGFLIWYLLYARARKRQADASVDPMKDMAMAMPLRGIGRTTDELPELKPIPPWQAAGGGGMMPPPGIISAVMPPPSFQAVTSTPIPPGGMPYERLLLLSSKVQDPIHVAESALPNVAVIVYDWKNWTLQELLTYTRKVLSGQKVLSICVVAPGSKPGCVGLLEGSQTSVDKLATKAELAQFWRALAGHVVANGVRDGRRIDLVGCRLMEAPSEGAALLKELWKETAVPFAAADDASTGYPLSTFIENPLTGDVAMISSRIKAMELYFNQYRLMHTSAASAAVALPGTVSQQQPLALQQPTASGMSGPSAAPLQPATGPTTSQSTVQARVASVGGGTTVNAAPSQPAASTAYQPAAQEAVDFAAAPSFSTGTVVAPATSSAPPAASSAPSGIFAEFAANLGGRDLREVFNRYDQDKSGGLSQSEVLAMVREVVPRATDMDLKHFRAMLDVDGNDIVTLDEFRRALEQNVAIGEKVAAGSDDSEVLQRLHEYLTDNEDLLRSVFKEFDADHSGALDHNELQQLITMIPGLDEAEKKYIMAYMYRCDSNRDQRLTFDELQAVVRSFGAKLNVVRSA